MKRMSSKPGSRRSTSALESLKRGRYEGRSARAPESFLQKLEVAIDHILDSTNRASRQIARRRYLMQRFPFGLIYRYDAESNTVTIFAVAHLKRRPGYWTDRPV